MRIGCQWFKEIRFYANTINTGQMNFVVKCDVSFTSLLTQSLLWSVESLFDNLVDNCEITLIDDEGLYQMINSVTRKHYLSTMSWRHKNYIFQSVIADYQGIVHCFDIAVGHSKCGLISLSNDRNVCSSDCEDDCVHDEHIRDLIISNNGLVKTCQHSNKLLVSNKICSLHW